MISLNHAGSPASSEYATVYLVFELSKAKWKLGLMLRTTVKGTVRPY